MGFGILLGGWGRGKARVAESEQSVTLSLENHPTMSNVQCTHCSFSHNNIIFVVHSAEVLPHELFYRFSGSTIDWKQGRYFETFSVRANQLKHESDPPRHLVREDNCHKRWEAIELKHVESFRWHTHPPRPGERPGGRRKLSHKVGSH